MIVYRGRTRVEIDVSRNDFLQDPIGWTQDLIGSAMGIHNKNVLDMKNIHSELVGDQSIKNKIRVDGNNEINNQEVENHLWKIWRFHTSYNVGRPIQYSDKSGEATNDDMKYFERYLTDIQKAKNDTVVYGDVFEYGVGYRMLITRRTDFDEEWQSPMEDFRLNPLTTFTAYSSDTSKDELFSCIITKTKERKTKRTITLYTIYYEDLEGRCNTFTLNHKYDLVVNSEKKEAYYGNPIIEYTSNEYRVGIVELIINLQNTLNKINSMQIDDIEQFIQAFLIFINNDVDLDTQEGIKAWKETVSLFKQTRAMVLKSVNEQMPADFKQVTNSLDHNAINSLHNRVKTAMYDITSTPQSSGSVTSGGDTTGARLLGNGWESALTDSNLTTANLKVSEYKWVKNFIKECRESTTKIDKIYPSSIEIKYDINMSDNLLVKTQAIANLKNANMPYDMILTIVPVLSDVVAGSANWKAFEEAKLKAEREYEVKKSQKETQADNNKDKEQVKKTELDNMRNQ